VSVRFILTSFLTGLSVLLAGLTAAVSASGTARAETKIQICHVPGNLDNFHTIEVKPHILDQHMAHGDFPDQCDKFCDVICDDGDACTVDDTGDCEELGCPLIPAAVDCDDGNVCTFDSCDSGLGCLHPPLADDTPCGTGMVCISGECVEDTPPPDPCPCFDEQDIRDVLAISGGFIQSCGSSQDVFGTAVDSTYMWYNNGDFACAGEGNGEFCHSAALPTLACVLITQAGTVTVSSATSAAEDATCRSHIQTVCDEILSPTSLARALGPIEPGAGSAPPVVDIDPSANPHYRNE